MKNKEQIIRDKKNEPPNLKVPILKSSDVKISIPVRL